MISLFNNLKAQSSKLVSKTNLTAKRTFYQTSKCLDSAQSILKENIPKPNLSKKIDSFPSTIDIDSRTKLTTLENGLRIVSDSTPGHFSAFGVYVDAGSRYETKKYSGISHFVDRISFKSTQSSTSEEIQAQLERLGGNIMSHSSREVMLLQGTVYNQDLENIVPLFADIIQKPTLLPHELDEQRIAIGYEVSDIIANPETYLPEQLHTAAYHNNTLGNTLLCTPDRVGSISPQMIKDYRQALYTPERIVIASMGQQHEKVVELVERNFDILTKQTSSKQSSFVPDLSQSKYTGGALFTPDPQAEFTQVYVAVEGVGINDPDLYPLATLQMLLGGGGSFSAGGPGKGMHSRLYRTVLNQYAWAHSFLAFNHSYKDSGLFGISAACPPRFNSDMLHVIAYSLASVAYPNQISPIELSRAKNQLKNNMMMSLESRLVGLEDLGQQILCTNKRVSVEEVCRRVDEVQLEDITRVASKLLLSPETKITLVGQGYYDGIEKTSEIFKKFGIGNGESLPRYD